MRKIVAILLIAFFVLPGCAKVYRKEGVLIGYSDTQLAPNEFLVKYNGNSSTGRERTTDFWFLRCSELTLMHDFNYFQIVQHKNYDAGGIYSPPSTSISQPVTFGNTTYVVTNTYGGGTQQSSAPQSEGIIRCYKDKPDNIHVYDASFLMNSIKTKYKMSN